MKINKAYKFRIYPNQNQKVIINKTFECTRLVYNHYLNKKQELYKKERKSITCYDCIKDLTNLYVEYPFLKEIDSMPLRCTLFDLDTAYKKLFQETSGYPKYKNKYGKASYRTNYLKNNYKGKIYENIKLDLSNKEITLPKLKQVKIKGYRNLDNIDGRIINATVSREANRYYVSVSFEQEIEIIKQESVKIIGIDLGIKDLVITSDFQKYENNKTINKYEQRIKRIQRKLSKKQKGSNNYYKLKQKLQRLYQKLKNTRKFLIHKITKTLTDENSIIVSETLKIKNMVKNHNLAKAINDASLSEIIRQLEYKTKWKGKNLIQIDPFYPSSQICSRCDCKNKITKNLSIREYECPNCHTKLDRDYNAALNIQFEGLKIYMEEAFA